MDSKTLEHLKTWIQYKFFDYERDQVFDIMTSYLNHCDSEDQKYLIGYGWQSVYDNAIVFDGIPIFKP